MSDNDNKTENAWRRRAKRLLHSGIPTPAPVRVLFKTAYKAGVCLAEFLRWFYAFTIVSPVVRSISKGGKALRIEKIPYVRGNGIIKLGSNICVSGKIGIAFSRHGKATPVLSIGDRTFIGHLCAFSLASNISIGSDCLIAKGVSMQDNDGHPLNPQQRLEKRPFSTDETADVLIGNNVWIGSQARILKGITIGDNAVVGAGSIVTHDVAPNSLAAGVPARFIRTLGGSPHATS